jgi:hypothetical protein
MRRRRMSPRSLVRIPRTVERLMLIWQSAPASWAWWGIITGELGTIAEELEWREAERAREESGEPSW